VGILSRSEIFASFSTWGQQVKLGAGALYLNEERPYSLVYRRTSWSGGCSHPL